MAYILRLSATAIMTVATLVKILKCMSYIYIFSFLALCTLRDVLCTKNVLYSSLWRIEAVWRTPSTFTSKMIS
jgi:hypothetical protein